METYAALYKLASVSAVSAILWTIALSFVWAHCDTMDGPVVTEARTALEKNDVTPVLKWVRKEDEPEVREAFAKAVAVRTKDAEARDLADRYFFETLVRLHRASEGEPYTGLKPSGTKLGPAVEGADRALETGQVDGLIKLVTEEIAKGIRKRFEQAMESKKHASESVEAGREFVRAYVEFVHYVDRLFLDATGNVEPREKDTAHTSHQH